MEYQVELDLTQVQTVLEAWLHYEVRDPHVGTLPQVCSGLAEPPGSGKLLLTANSHMRSM